MANGGMTANKDSVFTRDYGVEVEMLQIDDFEKSRDAFRAGGDKGGVDIMWTTVDAYALEYGGLSRLNPKAILQYDWSRGGDAIAVDSSIRSVADLKGKRLACAEATPSHYFGLYVLTQGGLTNRDVDWVFTASAVDAANVFKAGKVDAAVSWSPDVYVAAREREGGHILASTKEASNLIADVFVARGDFLRTAPRGRAPLRGRLAEGRGDGAEEPRPRGGAAAEEPHRREHPRGRARPCWRTSSCRASPRTAPSSTPAGRWSTTSRSSRPRRTSGARSARSRR